MAAYEAAFQDHREKLAPGEVATVMLIAGDRPQARTLLRYVRGLVESNGRGSGMLSCPFSWGGAEMAINPELHLWRAVLTHALSDAAKGKDADWIGSRDFALVCALAQVEPEALLRAYAPDRFTGRRKVA